MGFRTKLDYSDNRQIKQHVNTLTHLSGGTIFGVPYTELPTGPDLTTSGITETILDAGSLFYTSPAGVTTYAWYDDIMQLGYPYLSAITLSNSGVTQYVPELFSAATTTVIDGNTVALSYSGVSYDLTAIAMYDLGGGAYSGTVVSNQLNFISANTTSYTGRTIWVDVLGITRTDELIVTNGAQSGYVLTCINSEGLAEWKPSAGPDTGTTITGYWTAGTGTNAIITMNSANLANGQNALAEGMSTIAEGWASHAEGERTTAFGEGSHAEGSGTYAASFSHAEGQGSRASGGTSHAQGYMTTAFGTNSHSEGENSVASGWTSHAQGYYTAAVGDYSHASGYQSLASGITSHAQGYLTQANGDYSHSEGYASTAAGETSHAEGRMTRAAGDSSHAEGGLTIAIGDNSHAEGNSTSAGGDEAHAEGQSTVAIGSYSHAEGYSTTAGASGAHTEGNRTSAYGVYSHAEGSNTYIYPTGVAAHAEGVSTIASGNSAHAEGYQTYANGDYSHSQGYQTFANGIYSHAGGVSSSAMGLTSFVHGSNSKAIGNSTIVLGSNLTGSSANTTYVENLNIKSGASFTLGSTVVNENKLAVINATLSTGLYAFSNGGITVPLVGGDFFNLGAVKGVIVDSNDILNTNPTFVNYPGASGLTTSAMTTSPASYLMIDKTSTLKILNRRPTASERRDNIFLGAVGHASGKIDSYGNQPDILMNEMSQLRAMFEPLRLINEGVIMYPNGNTLQLANTAGTLYGLGIGFIKNGNNAPTIIPVSGGSPTTVQYRTQTSGAFPDTTVIDPNNWDNNGAVQSIGGSNNQATNQRFYLLEDASIRVQYGQTIYSTLTDAIAGANGEPFVVFPNNKNLGILIGILCVRKGTINLSNTDNAKFLPVSKFGESVGSAAGVSTTTLQSAYNNSADPEIVTNGLNNAVSIRRGTTTDTDIVLEVRNGVGSTRFSVNGFGDTVVDRLKIGSVMTGTLVNNLGVDVNGNVIIGGSGSGGGTGYWSAGTGTDAIATINGDNIADGDNSLAEGTLTRASGFASHAEGVQTIAGGHQSHAEGENTKAYGQNSHAEGTGTNATGYNAHAEGVFTTAFGDNSHTEGASTIASGYSSHAEGYYTTAFSDYCHVEGYATYAGDGSGYTMSLADPQIIGGTGLYNHAEGFYTLATGSSCHSEGSYTSAFGYASHAEGDRTIATGYAAHAEGTGTTASGQYSHAEGYGTLAYGISSHAEGYFTSAGDYAHAGSFRASATGVGSFVHGTGSTANTAHAIVLGRNITAPTGDRTYVDSLSIKTYVASATNDLGVTTGGVVGYFTSDSRLKENVETLTNALDKVKHLRGIKYQWKDRLNAGDEFRIGFIAQEVEAVEPLLTFKRDFLEGEFMGVHYKDVTALLVEAIKELSTEVTSVIQDSELIIPRYTPSAFNDTNGIIGSLTRDEDYLYVKTNTGWKRTKFENF